METENKSGSKKKLIIIVVVVILALLAMALFGKKEEGKEGAPLVSNQENTKNTAPSSIKEMLAGTLASNHNLYFIIHMVKSMRQAIIDDTFAEYKKVFLNTYNF